MKCSKKQYKTEDEAAFVAKEQMYIYKSVPLYWYLCDLCNMWHLTSK